MGIGDPLQEILYSFASQFRGAILGSVPSNSPLVSLRDFPHGACADASLLLAKYLQVNGCGRSFYVLGARDGQGHAWLQLDEFVVDITADQFEDQDAGVIVSGDSSWHTSFNGKVHSVADFCLYHRDTVFELMRAYQSITSHLEG